MKTLFIDGVAEGRIEEVDERSKYIVIENYKVFKIYTTHETFGIATCEEVNIEKALTKLFENYNKDLMILKGNAK